MYFNLQVGFIGLGNMGAWMARNLLKSGRRVIVHDKLSEPVDKLKSDGADVAGSPAEVAAAAKQIVTMVPSRYVTNRIAMIMGTYCEHVLHGLVALMSEKCTMGVRVSSVLFRVVVFLLTPAPLIRLCLKRLGKWQKTRGLSLLMLLCLEVFLVHKKES
jgi:D-arabinose 1-dehydrogenase-like Zn-dependent alcohol dehydrogenase